MPGPILISADVESAGAALEVAAALDELVSAVAAFAIRPEDRDNAALWRVEAYPREPVLDAAAEIRLALAAAGAGGRLIRIAEERLPERDWLSENRRAFPPQRVGRFLIHGSHWQGLVPASAIGIEIDAATEIGRA